ncbi:hypothetical protein [Virgisporangium aurantiacum]|uniref:hypothetical protein n=1 Tax=Virgisporangium aurantiacum TaxID=175570 RepID=UPI001EF195E2|nr:hypothetical protein [Virgisporangium aurantiacum]
MRRRTLLSAAGAAAVGAGTGVPLAAPKPAALRAVSMATHVHGSFSEGVGSFDSHLAQARKHKVDVVWFTDHDFRIAAYDHRREVRFDAAVEPENGLDWTWTQTVEGAPTGAAAAFVAGPRSPGEADEVGNALRLAAGGGNGTLWYAGAAWNATEHAAIGDTTLTFDALPEAHGPAALLLLELQLSYHPAHKGRPAGIYTVRYEIGGVAQTGHTAAGLVGTVRLAAKAGVWQRFTVVPVDDVRRLWPDLVAGDNAVTGLRFGVRTTGPAVSFVVDRLRFERARRQGQAGEQLRAETLAQYADAYDSVTPHLAYEISLVRHLNWYGGDLTLPAFTSPPRRDNTIARTEEMVARLRPHGGVICWNHPLDVEKRDGLARLMVERNAIGVDLIEIGRKEITDLLWVLDVAARNALFVTAVGGSDDHEGHDWLTNEEHYLTYVWAPSTERTALVTAMRKGAAWFTDMARYRGSMDLRINGTSYLGGVVVSARKSVTVKVVATAMPPDATLEVVTGVVDEAGVADLTPSTMIRPFPAKAVKGGLCRVGIEPGNGTYVRSQVRAADGSVIGASNPLWLLPTAPTRPVPDDRRWTLS